MTSNTGAPSWWAWTVPRSPCTRCAPPRGRPRTGAVRCVGVPLVPRGLREPGRAALADAVAEAGKVALRWR